VIPTGVTWKLKCYKLPSSDSSCNEAGINLLYTLRFEKNGIVSGTDACNTCTGTYSYGPATQLSIHWSCTEVVCDPPNPLSGYGPDVASTTSFALVNDQLVLTLVVQGEESLRIEGFPAPRHGSGSVLLEMVYQRGE